MTFRRILDRNISGRRIFLFGIVLCSLLLYTAPPFFRWLFSSSYKKTYQFHDDQAAAAVAGTCIDRLLLAHTSAIRSRDAVLTLSASSLAASPASPHDPQHHEHVPLVGNGHVGLLVGLSGHCFHEPCSSALFLRSTGRTLSLRIPYEPATVPPPIGSARYYTPNQQQQQPTVDTEAVLIHYADGYVQHVQCARAPVVTSSTGAAASSDAPVHVTHQFVAHRSRAGLLVQRVVVYNAGRQPVSVMMGGGVVPSGSGGGWATTLQSRTDSVMVRGESHSYTLYTGVINMQRSQVLLNSTGFVDNTPVSQSTQSMYMAVAIVTSHLPSTITVAPLSSRTFSLFTSVNYTEPRLTPLLASNLLQTRRIADTAVTTLTSAFEENADQLMNAHTDIWRQHWKTGFSISHSLADDVINGDVINATFYYVLSQSRAPLHEQETSKQRAVQLSTLLSDTEGCYGDKVDTLQARRLWSPLRSLTQVLDTANLWLMLLEKKGCHNLLKVGADGVMQAMVLSMGALKFSNQHLELGLEPKHMHRDYMFRNLQFGNSTFINISVLVNADNRAQLAVSARESQQSADGVSLYACDAGCLDAPVRLGSSWTILPVKQTDPATSVLYITADWQHALELKHTIHVQEINLAPAHDHGLISMHRHGHTLATVPTLFWLTVFLLIFLFHAFLIKLIANEFCSGGGSAGFSGDSRSARTRKSSDLK